MYTFCAPKHGILGPGL